MHPILSALGIVAASSLAATPVELDAWKSYKTKYSKVYSNDKEENHRMDMFLDNRRQINRHNELYDRGLSSFQMGLNKYSDMSSDEFIRSMNGIQLGIFRSIREAPVDGSSNSTVQESSKKSIDWRLKGAVNEVVQNTKCTSWTFAALGNIEGQRYLKGSMPLLPLSAQNLIDCTYVNATTSDETDSCYGCHGGTIPDAFRYIKDHGIDSEKDYPFEDRDMKCKYPDQKSNITISDFIRLPKGDEKSLQEAIFNIGPIAAVISVIDPDSFMMYKAGIYENCGKFICNDSKSKHAVLIVGFDTDSQGRDYYILKNFWGRTWGENGYMRLRANQNNLCSISSWAYYAILDDL